MNTDPKTSRRGFTLLELLLAMTILAILLAVAVPGSGRSFRRLTLTDAASALAANIRYAQAKAVAEALTVRIVFDAPRGQYAIQYIPAQAAGEPTFQPLAEPAGRTFLLPDGVAFEQVDLLADDGVTRAESLLFRPDGRGGLGTIRLTSQAGRYELNVTPRLGQVTVTSLPAAPEAAR